MTKTYPNTARLEKSVVSVGETHAKVLEQNLIQLGFFQRHWHFANDNGFEPRYCTLSVRGPTFQEDLPFDPVPIVSDPVLV
jgi:hypothetical protein